MLKPVLHVGIYEYVGDQEINCIETWSYARKERLIISSFIAINVK